MAETHRSLGFLRVPKVLDFQFVGIPNRQRGLCPKRPRRPVLLHTRLRLNVALGEFLIVAWA